MFNIKIQTTPVEFKDLSVGDRFYINEREYTKIEIDNEHYSSNAIRYEEGDKKVYTYLKDYHTVEILKKLSAKNTLCYRDIIVFADNKEKESITKNPLLVIKVDKSGRDNSVQFNCLDLIERIMVFQVVDNSRDFNYYLCEVENEENEGT